MLSLPNQGSNFLLVSLVQQLTYWGSEGQQKGDGMEN